LLLRAHHQQLTLRTHQAVAFAAMLGQAAVALQQEWGPHAALQGGLLFRSQSALLSLL
jgi:hypothetical protein